MAEQKRRVRVAKGIYADQWGVSVCVKVMGHQLEQRFLHNTRLETLQAAREKLIEELRTLSPPRRVRRGGDADQPLLDRRAVLFGYKESYIYFILDGDQVKIGRTSDVETRIGALQGSNPRPLSLLLSTLAYDYVERRLHEKFAHLRINREWFRYGPEIAMFVQRVKDGADIVAIAD